MPSKLLITAVVLGLASVGSAALGAEQGPAADVPELKILDQYSGAWTTTGTNSDGKELKGTAISKWVLGGRFQQTNWKSDDKSDEGMILRTYDQQAKKYRSWFFHSQGGAFELTGDWNETTKTFTGKGKLGDGAVTDTAKFPQAGTEEWKLVFTNATGEVTSELKGVNTRKDK